MAKKRNKYVTNEELLKEISLYKATVKYDSNNKYIEGSGIISNRLGEMILYISRGLANKGCFARYTYKEDFIMQGVLTVLKYIHNFNPEKYDNPFAYITQICFNSFRLYITKEKKVSYIKDVCFNNEIDQDFDTVQYHTFSHIIGENATNGVIVINE